MDHEQFRRVNTGDDSFTAQRFYRIDAHGAACGRIGGSDRNAAPARLTSRVKRKSGILENVRLQLVRLPVLIAVAMLVSAPDAAPCFASPRAPQALVRDADVIVRARASSTEVVSARSGIGTERVVRFVVLEQLKGPHQFDVAAPGQLSERAEMNPGSVPYATVKPSGLSGSCVAMTYQKDGEYLLFLKKVDGVLTPYWAPLSATNEQIVGPQDKWVLWVKEQLLHGKTNK